MQKDRERNGSKDIKGPTLAHRDGQVETRVAGQAFNGDAAVNESDRRFQQCYFRATTLTL